MEAMRRDRPDVAFLDMQMPGCDGLQAVAGLEPCERPAVVFVTAYQKYAVDAFDVRAVDYVLKPFDGQRIATALARAAEVVRGRRASGGTAVTGMSESKGPSIPADPTRGSVP